MTKPRVADDFSTIRVRMEELCRERARPRAADDFPTIRARMEELRRERAQVLAEAEPFGDPFEALSSCRKYESEHEGRQHFPRVTAGPELSGGWTSYCTALRGPDPNPLLLAILRSSPMMERKPRASEALPPGMMPPPELRRQRGEASGSGERHRRTCAGAYGAAHVRSNYLSLQEPELVRFRRERADSLNIAFTSVFPGAVFVQISNSLAVRQIRPRGIGEVEIFQTMLGYADDPPDLTLHRLRQANLVGPAGLVSMEGRTNGEMRSQPRERASGVGLVLLTAG